MDIPKKAHINWNKMLNINVDNKNTLNHNVFSTLCMSQWTEHKQ